ncbi:MAG: GNAT family N-acetyltransferase [Bacteroidota bacterium]
MNFRSYTSSDRSSCIQLLEANTPAYFAPNERADYVAYLDKGPTGYMVCERDEKIIAAFGFAVNGTHGRVQWIMTSPAAQGSGMGGAMMRLVLQKAEAAGVQVIDIAASQKSAPFFAHYGAVEIKFTAAGWGPGLDRIDMELTF